MLVPLAFFFFIGERGHFNKSTWMFFREGGLHLSTLHGYIYGRWTPQYIKALFGSTAGAPKATKGEYWLSDHYHGKVLTHDHARAIVCLNKSITKRDLDQVVPYPIARDLVLNAPPDIVIYECVCRNSRPSHCEPTQVRMVIGHPFTDMILEHQPQSG